MANKKAFLVCFTVTTRITAIPDSNGDISDDDIEIARERAVASLKNDGPSDHLEKYEEDQEMPYDKTDDDNSDQ